MSIGALAGCGGDDDGTSPASLKDRLLPESELPGFKIVRNFEWDNPIDFVVEGIHLPEATPRSRAVEAFEDFGFEAGVGVDGPGGNVGLVQLGSDEDARKALDYVRKEALKQPCFAVCAVDSFTIGPRLFQVGAGGEPGQVKKERVLEAAKALYERNTKSGAAS